MYWVSSPPENSLHDCNFALLAIEFNQTANLAAQRQYDISPYFHAGKVPWHDIHRILLGYALYNLALSVEHMHAFEWLIFRATAAENDYLVAV